MSIEISAPITLQEIKIGNSLTEGELNDLIEERIEGIIPTAGDILVQAGEGLTRLPVGSNGQVLAVVDNAPAYVDFVGPTEAIGDLIVRGEGGPVRLPIGTDLQILAVVDAYPAYVDMPEVGLDEAAVAELISAALVEADLLVDPTAAAGDLILRGDSGLVALPIGADGTRLEVVGGELVYVDPGDTPGGTALPVADTTALVKDPVTETKQIRIDAGNVLASTTVVLQSPGVSAVVGTLLIERSFASFDPHLIEGFAASRAGIVTALSGYFFGTLGTYPIAIRTLKNNTPDGESVFIASGNNISGGTYGRASMSYAFAAGDVIAFELLSGGSNDYFGSGMAGSPASGTLVAQLEVAYTPAL